MPSEPEIRDLLRRFADAWARRDVDALLAMMTDDAVYAASVGPEPGRTFRGHPELVAGFREMFAHDSGALVEQGEPEVFGARAVRTWTCHFPDDRRCERGVDLRRFRDGKIAEKDAYRKTTP
jgi:ketosteroid isomerase-like protein